ncbi:MAG: hypothetical protein K2Q26_13740, partial [Bdellovibrionales bacterium]|nr:hypothetical protein [Bdellovibrionales bacterium]
SHGFMPIRTTEGSSCAFPYILPFGKIEEWASLPIEGARELSRLCLETSIELFGRVGQKMTIGELLRQNPRVSLPIEIGAHQSPPSLDTEIVSFLETRLKMLK